MHMLSGLRSARRTKLPIILPSTDVVTYLDTHSERESGVTLATESGPFQKWLLHGADPSQQSTHKDPWWKVMCLTGVDYFSSMGFQPGISFLAAGALAPLATLNLVVLTLIGALPAYWFVAKESPHGQGSFRILESILLGWKGKTLVLVLLGFAATDFIFTITMCAADATAHIVENPWMIKFPNENLVITSSLIGTLGLVFLFGFSEAMNLSLVLVIVYLAVNAVTLFYGISELINQPHYLADWLKSLNAQYPSGWEMFKKSFLAFPQLALGLSGFETGVAVMTHIDTGTPDNIDIRVRNTRKLLVWVASIMSIFLILGNLVATILIPPAFFAEDGPANGRALAYLTHKYVGDTFGTIYDISTVAILWFAGASGMAALLSLVPQYLPRYGMAPDWALATRPLVIFFTLVSLFITFVFKADVDSQAGAFATGLLVLITSGICAVTTSMWRVRPVMRLYFLFIAAIFVYASIAIMFQRPDGLQISLAFTATIVATSFISRAARSTELRVTNVQLDETAQAFVKRSCEEHWGEIRLLAHRPDDKDYLVKESASRRDHSIQNAEGNFIFLEVTPGDVSEFKAAKLIVTGHTEGEHQVLRCSSPSVPNAIAALLLHIRDVTGKIPHAYLGWTEGHPLGKLAKYILFGEGETAPLTREILRQAEEDPEKRPKVHVA